MSPSGSSFYHHFNQCPLGYRAAHHPDQIAFIDDRRSWSYLEANWAVIQIEEYFRHRFFKLKQTKKNLIIGLFLSNSIYYSFVLVALYRLGWSVIPLNVRKPISLIVEELNEVEVDGVICEAEDLELFKQSNSKWIHISMSVIKDKVENRKENQVEKESCPTFFPVSPKNQSTLIFTSGTTGKSKIAIFTLENHLFNAYHSNRFIPFGQDTGDQDDRWLMFLPLYHVSGQAVFFRSLVGGGCMVIPSNRSIKDSQLFSWVVENRITHLSLVSSQLNSLASHLSHSQLDRFFGLIKYLLLGGGPISERLWNLVHRYPVIPTYGMTESNAQIATYSKRSEQFFLEVLPHRKVKLKDGEILLHHANLFQGYLEQRKLILPWKSDWFHTGDLAESYQDRNGKMFLKPLGRKNNLFISGGENISPEEIEKHLLSIENIKEARILPIDHFQWGQVPIGVIQVEESFTWNQKLVHNYLDNRIEKYKIPKKIYFSYDLPVNKLPPTRIQEYLRMDKLKLLS